MQKLLCNNLQIKSEFLEDGYFTGYASVYHEIDSHEDVILPGAFKECLNKPESIKLLWQHDTSRPIGVFKKMEETENGIYVEGKIIVSTRRGKEVLELIREGAVDGLSIGFEIQEHYIEGKHRYISKGKLWEVSIVTFPANGKARINNVKDSVMKELVGDLDKAIYLINTLKGRV